MKLTARDIAQQLAQRAEAFARWLMPSAVLESGMLRAGSVAGEPGHSLAVEITGPRAGRWRDWANQTDHGDLLDLARAVRGGSMGDAIRLAKDWLGIREPANAVPRKTYSRPGYNGIHRPIDESPVTTCLEETRRLDFFTRDAFRIREHLSGQNGPEIVFPSFNPAGELVNVKWVALKRTEDGKKITRQSKGCAPSLFGWQAMNPATREVIITEGEIDAMTWHQMGFPALSVPDGAGGTTWIDVEWDNLERFDTIYLNWDNDEEGRKNVVGFARRLGLARCLIIRLPEHKDANEAMQAGKGEAWFSAAIASATPYTPEQIKEPIEFLEAVRENFYPQPGADRGFVSYLLPKLRFRPCEVTIWTGISSHGKSTFLIQLMLEAALCGYKVAIASMEMVGQKTLSRMLCQSVRANPIPEPDIEPMLRWMSGKVWIYDLLGNVAPKALLELMEYSYARSGVQHFVIDSLMKCSIDSEDYEAQRLFMNDLCSFAHETGAHIHLVAHPRKGVNESQVPGKLDVKGGVDLTNEPDNQLTVHRNKDKEDRCQKGELPSKGEADTRVYCKKQRENGDEFTAAFRHMRGIYRFARMEDDEDQLDLDIRGRLAQPDLLAGQQSTPEPMPDEEGNEPF
jgi:twinkle protein